MKYLVELLKSRNCASKTDEEIQKIAHYLNSHEEHATHGSGICLTTAKDIGLHVMDLSLDKELEDAVLSIYHAATIMFERTDIQKIICNHLGKTYINKFSPA